MDSVTQFVLGAAVGKAVMGHHMGRRAFLWGGICGTLPDLDVFLPLGDPVSDFTYHRSFSHSLFVLALLTPLLAIIAKRMTSNLRGSAPSIWRWACMIYAVFATHVLLDSFTAYGTQIFWPLYATPMTWSTIFIIDPLYTLPLIIGLVVACFSREQTAIRWNHYGLIISSLYLGWTMVAKSLTSDQFERNLVQQGLAHDRIFTGPTPFNSLLWRAVVMSDHGYYEGFYSLLDGKRPIHFQFYSSQVDLNESLAEIPAARRLRWFTKGFYKLSLHNAADVSQQTKHVRITDLRMGLEPIYVFQFDVASLLTGGDILEKPPTQHESERSLDGLSGVWRRIWHPEVTIKMVK